MTSARPLEPGSLHDQRAKARLVAEDQEIVEPGATDLGLPTP